MQRHLVVEFPLERLINLYLGYHVAHSFRSFTVSPSSPPPPHYRCTGMTGYLRPTPWLT